jgi:hypothetical protein
VLFDVIRTPDAGKQDGEILPVVKSESVFVLCTRKAESMKHIFLNPAQPSELIFTSESERQKLDLIFQPAFCFYPVLCP